MRLQRTGATLRRVMLLALACAVGLLVASSCQRTDDGAEERLSKMESSIARVNGLATQVQTLEGKDQGIEGRVATLDQSLNQSVAELEGSINELSKKVAASSGSHAELRKKIDAVSGQVGSVSSKVSSVEQKISLLETRYNDHLRKYHSGG